MRRVVTAVAVAAVAAMVVSGCSASGTPAAGPAAGPSPGPSARPTPGPSASPTPGPSASPTPGAPRVTAPPTSKGNGSGSDVQNLPADYKVMIVRDGQVVATFTAGQLSDLTGHGQRSRGPGPLLADVLVAAHADDRSRSLVIDGYGGDQLTIAVKDVLDTPGDYPIFLTQRSTAKLDTPIGTVRHVSTITVRNPD